MKPGIGYRYLFWLVGLILAVLSASPTVSANHPEAGDYTFATIEYHLTANGTTNQDISTTTQLMSLTFTDSPRNDFDVSSHLLIFHLANTGIYRADSTGEWEITTTLDDVPLDDCSYIIRTFNSGVLGGDLPVVPHHSPACTVQYDGDGVNGGPHTLNITATIIQGTPADLENYNTHVTIRRQDTYMIPQDLTGQTLEHWIPVILFLGLMLWSLWNAWVLPGLAASLGMAGVYIPGLWSEVAALFLFMLTIWLHYYIERRKDHFKL